jgi:hypothetical protein
MIKTLKKLWDIRTKILLWLFRIGVPAGIAWIVFLLDRHVYPVNLDDPHLEQRIAFVSLWVAIVGFSLAVLGTIVAVLEFQASQRKPDLHLWLEEEGQKTVKIPTDDMVRFTLFVQNGGTRVARYISCMLEFSALPATNYVEPSSRVGL